MQSAPAPQVGIGPARYPNVISGDDMRARDFWNMIEADDQLKVVCCHEADDPRGDYVAIKFTVTDGVTLLHPSEILRNHPEDLRDLLKFRRPARLMVHHPSYSARGWLPERIAS